MNCKMHGRIAGPRLFIATLLCIVTFAVSSAAAAFKNLKVGDQALPIELKDLEGNDRSLTSYQGTGAVLVLFWATWSERSLKELEDLNTLKTEYGEKGLKIVTVNVEGQSFDTEDFGRIRSAILERKIDFPVLIDDGLKTYNEWGVIATPTTALVDEEGTIIFDLSSYPTSGFLDMDEAVRKALGLMVKEETHGPADTAYKPPRNAMLHFGLGKRHVEKGFLTKALPEFQKSAEADTKWADPRIYMAYVQIKEGHREEARENLQEAGNLDPGREETTLLSSYLLAQEQKVDEALALLQSKMSGDPAAPPETPSPGAGKDGMMEPEEAPSVSAGADSLEVVRSLVEEGKREEASRRLEEILVNRLSRAGFQMRKVKNLSAMDKMKLMMEKKQEQQ